MKPTKGYYMIPAARLEAVNKALADAGLGNGFFSVPIVRGNGKVATHYAASCSLHPWQQAKLDAVLSREKPGEVKQPVEQQLSRSGFLGVLAAQAAKDKQSYQIQSVADRLAEVGARK